MCHFTSAHKADDVRIFYKECCSIAAAGYTVFLVAPNAVTEEKKGVRIVGVEAHVSGRYNRMLNTSRIIYKKALSIDADIYHFHDPELLPYGLKLKRKGKKVIYDAHEDVPRQILGKYWIGWAFRSVISRAFERYENYIARNLDQIITATPFICERFKKINKNTKEVCNYPIINEIHSSGNWSEKRNEICYVGGITKIRGNVEVVKALEGLEVKLNLAGDYSPVELRDEMKALKGWQNVVEYGFVGREKISEILLHSKAGIVTLYPQINYLDSLPIKMFEYMLAGIPVIASNFPLWKEIVESNSCGICVDPLNVDEIRKGISKIIENDAAAEKMGQNGRKAVVEKYNWSVEEKKLINIYNVLSGR